MVMDIKEIMEIIPHRQPFLLIDRIEELEPGKRAVGKKCVTYNEPFFNGHFPQEPVMPGVLILDCLLYTSERQSERPSAVPSSAQAGPEAMETVSLSVIRTANRPATVI